ncbi:hypothetical protein wcw_0510 [Waddlia chondrophila WSU 86-1044]|uniref:Uncharacterized protein n=1 Tax=Waddlia chondrophila (strain ATCC VR-1470 / WSU 86-1044) TaxID=716544 RepID=D6YUS0_WADCW|nr:hypothetical protein wcw_0510 [Waddlia chondrophila WSU 86-1044]
MIESWKKGSSIFAVIRFNNQFLKKKSLPFQENLLSL